MLQAQRQRQDTQASTMYGHQRRESVPRTGGVDATQYDRPIGPVRVNPNQYAEPIGPSYPHADVNPNQYAEPIGPKRQSTAGKVASAARKAVGVFEEVGMNPHIRQIASGSGFGMTQPAPSRQRRAPPQQAGEPQPGGTIYITRCDEYGNCKQTKVGGTRRKPQQRSPSYFAGTLGGTDPGFR